MTASRKVLLLVGSGRLGRSTSASLGAYLLQRLRERDWETESLQIYSALRSGDGATALVKAARGAHLVVVSAPLFWDSLPAAVVRALELIAEDRRATPVPHGQRFAYLVNSGFPEASQSATALAIARRFAAEAGFEWGGGLALGAGESIQGRPLERVGRMARHVRKALDLAAEALSSGRTIPEEAAQLMAKPLLPAWAYVLFGGLAWRRRARSFGAQSRLGERPYEQ